MQYRTSYVQVVHTYTMLLAHGWPGVTHRSFPWSVASCAPMGGPLPRMAAEPVTRLATIARIYFQYKCSFTALNR